MKKNNIIGMALCCLIAFTACDSERPVYEGEQYVLFTDTLHYAPVTEGDGFVYEVEIGTTTASNVDRHYIVDVNQKKSEAQEGYHYEIISRNVTIKAGEYVGTFKIKGIYENLQSNEVLAISLNIIGAEEEMNPLYRNECTVCLVKCLPFNIRDYVGDVRMAATFPFSTSNLTYTMLKTEYINDSTLRIKEPFDQNHDLVIRFHTGKDNPFDQDIEMTEQIAFTDASFGDVAMKTTTSAPSFYLPEERAFVICADVFIPAIGSFGTYTYIFEWRSPEQAEADKNGLTTPYSLKRTKDWGLHSFFTEK